MLYYTGLKFNTIYLLDSIPEGELQSGQELHDAVLLPRSRTLEGFHVEHHHIDTRVIVNSCGFVFDQAASFRSSSSCPSFC